MADEGFNRALHMPRPVAREKHVIFVHEGRVGCPVHQHCQWISVLGVNACYCQSCIVNRKTSAPVAITVLYRNGRRTLKDWAEWKINRYNHDTHTEGE